MGTNRRSAPRIHELAVTLSDVEPVVWRRLRVSSGATLSRVARVIAISLGWPPGRPYAVHVAGLGYASRPPGAERRGEASGNGTVEEPRLRQLLPDAGAELEFEYGAEPPWHLMVRLERLLPPNEEVRTPWCESGAGAAPPIDAGGPWAWEEHRTAGLTGTEDEVEPGFNPAAVNAQYEEERKGRRL
jgi:hypothetical protein